MQPRILLGLTWMCGWMLCGWPAEAAAPRPAPVPPSEPPAIVQSPRDGIATEGESMVFEVRATGSELQFQWQRDDRVLPGATNEILRLSALEPRQEGRYSVRVYNLLGEQISAAAQLRILQRPSIQVQPLSQTVTQGIRLSLEVAASGTAPFQFQWFRNGETLPGENRSSLQFESVQPQHAGSYSAQVWNAVGSATTKEAQLRVLSPPRWTSVPKPLTLAEGRPATLAAHAEGTAPLVYQWYRNGQPVAGASGPGLEFAALRPEDEGDYALSVSNGAGRDWTPVVKLRVLSPPRILSAPTDQVVGRGSNLVLRVEAMGSEPLYYGWRRNGVDLFGDPAFLGPDTSTLVLPSVDFDQAGIYELVVCNFAGLTTTAPIAVQVERAPFIITQPPSFEVSLFDDLVLTVEAGGSPTLTYQWYHDGAVLQGATNATLGPIFVQQDAAGAYLVAVQNAFGTVYSDPALISLNQPRLDPADSLAAATELSLPIGCTIWRGMNVGFTRQPGEPDHAQATGGASGWYRWRASENAIVTLQTTGSAFDTLLAIYTGTSLQTLSPVASSEDAPGVLTSRLVFPAVAGTDYWIAIDGFDGESGEFVLTAIVQPSQGQALPTPLVSPLSSSGPAGRATNLVVVAQGEGLSYQWYFLGKPLPGENADTLHLPQIQPQDVGSYFVRVWAKDRSTFVDSATAVIEIGSFDDVVSRDKRYLKATHPESGVPGAPPLARPGLADVSTSAGTIVVRPGVNTDQILNNFSSTWSWSDPRNCNWVGGATRWLTNIVVEKRGVLVIDTRGSAVPTLTGLFSYVSARAKLLACSQNGIIAYTNETDGAIYDLMADSVQGQGGLISIRMSLIQPPVISSAPPLETYAEMNQPLVLDAGVTNDPVPAPTYQWFLNETNELSQAVGRTLSLGSFQITNTGWYSVRVRTALGDITRRVALVSPRYPAAWSMHSLRAIVNGGEPGALWARNASEAYLWINGFQPGSSSIPEARLFRSAGSEWELVLKMPWCRGVLAHGSGPSDVAVWLSRSDVSPALSLLLTSEDRGATWATNVLPVLALRQPARRVAGSAQDRQVLLGDGTVLRQRGSSWVTLVTPGADALIDLSLVDDQHGFAIGRHALSTWDGSRWVVSGAAPAQFTAEALCAFSSGDQYYARVVGREESTAQLRIWNAAGPSLPGTGTPPAPDPVEASFPASDLSEAIGFWGTSVDHLFLAGRRADSTGALLQFDGRRWLAVSELGGLPFPAALNGVDRDEVWVPLRDGRMARRQTLRPAQPLEVAVLGPRLPVVEGSSAELQSQVFGTGPFFYRWRFEDRELPGETNASLLIRPVAVRSAGRYQLEVSTAEFLATAETRISEVNIPPQIRTQPQELESYAGGTAVFQVQAEGDRPLAYQWFTSTGPIPGETGDTLTLLGVRAADAGAYWAVVSNAFGAVTTEPARFKVSPGFHLFSPRVFDPFQIEGVADAPFVVERSPDLETWTPWFTNQVLRFAVPFQLLDSDTQTHPQRFYRVRGW